MNRIGNLTRLICTLLQCDDHTCIYIYQVYCSVYPQLPPVIGAPRGCCGHASGICFPRLLWFGGCATHVTPCSVPGYSYFKICTEKSEHNCPTSYWYNTAILASFILFACLKGCFRLSRSARNKKNANVNQQKTRLEASKPPTYFTTALSLGCFVLPSLLPFYSIVYCERNELLICKVHQFGLGCIKKCVHANQSEYHFGTSLIHFGVVIFGNSMILHSLLLYPFRHSVCSIPGSLYSVLLRTSVISILLLAAVVGAPIATPVFFYCAIQNKYNFFTFFLRA